MRANPGKVNYASSGNALQHVTTELLKDLTKTYMTHIPYRGTGPALTDLLAGTVDLTITTPPPLLPHIKSGKLKALMVTGKTRLPALPNIPTATEAGVPLVASSWFAVYGRRACRPELQTRLSAAVRQVVETPEFRRRAEEQGAKAGHDAGRAGRAGPERARHLGAHHQGGADQGRLKRTETKEPA